MGHQLTQQGCPLVAKQITVRWVGLLTPVKVSDEFPTTLPYSSSTGSYAYGFVLTANKFNSIDGGFIPEGSVHEKMAYHSYDFIEKVLKDPFLAFEGKPNALEYAGALLFDKDSRNTLLYYAQLHDAPVY